MTGAGQMYANDFGLAFLQLAQRTWDLIDPDNRLKRSFKEATQAAQLTNGNAFTRHSLRFASQHKVQAMLWHPDDVDGGADGVVVWAAHHNIKVFSISTQVRIKTV